MFQNTWWSEVLMNTIGVKSCTDRLGPCKRLRGCIRVRQLCNSALSWRHSSFLQFCQARNSEGPRFRQLAVHHPFSHHSDQRRESCQLLRTLGSVSDLRVEAVKTFRYKFCVSVVTWSGVLWYSSLVFSLAAQNSPACSSSFHDSFFSWGHDLICSHS